MGMKILLVDDSSIIRGIMKKTLALTGIEIDSIKEACDGQQALESVTSNPTDLIFLDINMPVMNGVEFMRELRNNEATKQIPVVVVSTEGSDERIKQMESLQIHRFIRKPFTPERIAEILNDVAGGQHE
jgi:two-component system chemotaxis response regulator CheY